MDENLEPIQDAPVDHSSDLAELLAQYNKPMENTGSTEPVEQDEKAAYQNIGETFQEKEARRIQDEMTDNNPATGWQGNPRYYQSGKKAGQLKPGRGFAKQVTLEGNILDGAMFITLIDTIVPMLIAMANNSFSAIKVDPDKMMLTEKQKKMLEPICEKVVEKLAITADPVWVLVLSVLSLYGIQFWTIRTEAKLEHEQKQAGT